MPLTTEIFKIGLIDVDGHNFPNLPLMKLSAWHKAKGDDVEWYVHDGRDYDCVWMSKVFSFTPDYPHAVINANAVGKGGTGYAISIDAEGREFYDPTKDRTLNLEAEHIMPDYSLYGITDMAYGFLTRGCPRACPFCHVATKEGRASLQVASITEFWAGQSKIVLCDPNLLACKSRLDLLDTLAETKAEIELNQGLDARFITEDVMARLKQIRMRKVHFAWDLMAESEAVLRGLALYAREEKRYTSGRRVFVLTNFNTTLEEDLFRVMKLRELGYLPYIMIYDKGRYVQANGHLKKELPFSTEQIVHFKRVHALQRWVNNILLWRKIATFGEYLAYTGKVDAT